MKHLLLLLIVTACASMEKSDISRLSHLSHPECELKKEDFRRSLFAQTGSGLGTTLGTTGSFALTTVGYATDLVIVTGPFIALAVICSQSSGGCNGNIGDAATFGFRIYGDADFKGFGAMGYGATSSWRCPHVDHISQALRQAASCNVQKGNYSGAFAHLNLVTTDELLKNCVSELEKMEVHAQRELINSTAVPN